MGVDTMKKNTCVLLVMFLSLTLISCGDNETKKTTDESKSSSKEDDNTVKEDKKAVTVDEKKKDVIVESSEKQTYIDKLDKIKVGLKDLEKLYAGNTVEMKGAAGQEYDRWDAALNEIYGVLKTQLSETEMSSLDKDEMQWIRDKEAKANAAAAEWAGGTGEQLQYLSSVAQSTRDRCYLLVNEYMK